MSGHANKPPVLLIMGATATGKTELAVQLVERFPVEIISVDSALIYRDMDIGTAKPDADTLRRAPHHLIDILDPAESWSVWEFVQAATKLIDEIHARGHIPLLVGGTMMYFNALQQGMNDLPQTDPQIRDELNRQLAEQGLEALFEQLQQVDAVMAQRLKPSDTQRILRALEVFRSSGQPMSVLQQQATEKPDLDFRQVILEVPERAELHQRIERRFQQMIEQGFEQEVEKLRARGDLSLDQPSMRCVGYRQMWMYLDGNYSHTQMVERSVIATRQLAKRQITWLRKYQQALRVDYKDVALSDVSQYLGLE
jgi:tRNA dimethylallyltransferase